MIGEQPLKYEVQDDGIYTYNGIWYNLVMPKEIFVAAYNQWIKKKSELYYFVDGKSVMVNTKPTPNWDDYKDDSCSTESYDKYSEAWEEHIKDSTLVDEFYTEAVAQRVCDELNARRILEDWYGQI